MRSSSGKMEKAAADDSDYKQQTKILRRYLKLYLYSAFKWKNGVCSLHLLYCLLFTIQIVKVGLITGQIFDFGQDRANFSSVVTRGHLAIRHLLQKGWDASWETLPYPPAQGDFAVYTIDDLVESVDYAVSRYYNAEQEAIGYYVRLPRDKMMLRLKHFDFPGFKTSDMDGGVHINDDVYEIKNGLHLSNESGIPVYNYSIMDEFQHLGLDEPIKRLLSISLCFTLHSVRVHVQDSSASCLKVVGKMTFMDLDNNGQVNVELETDSQKIPCREMGLAGVKDWDFRSTAESIGVVVIMFCVISLITTAFSVTFAGFVCLQTKVYMKKYYRRFYNPVDENETDLPVNEYFKFVKFWDILVILSDVFTLLGTIKVIFLIEDKEWVLETLDKYTVALGAGCAFAWINLLRYFKFHNKFHLLFNTLYGALGDVMAYLLCVGILFLGFWVCGYVVMGPYHVKFRTPKTAMETLFSIVNGDEIFATLAILEEEKSGGDWVFWFSRIYIGCYVAIFTIVVINLLIGIFMSTYEAIKQYYEETPEERDLGSMERALRRYLQSNLSQNPIRASLYNLMADDTGSRTSEEAALRRELSKIVRTTDKTNDIVLMKPRTLRAFIEDDGDKSNSIDCRWFKCRVLVLGRR